MKINTIKLSIYVATIGISILLLISSGNNESANTSLENKVSFNFDENTYLLTVHSNAIPKHMVGNFPNSNNPNTISPQNLTFIVPTNPIKNPTLDPKDITVQGKVFAIAINGVFFEPFTAEFYDTSSRRRVQQNPSNPSPWNFDGLGTSNRGEGLGMDKNLAHVQPNGTYHYHGDPTALDTGNSTTPSPFIAFAGDGYPVLGKYELDENGAITEMQSCWQQKTSRDEQDAPPIDTYPMGTFVQDYEYNSNCTSLDKHNGHYATIPMEIMEQYIHYYSEYSYTKNADDTITMYHYHTTEKFPYVARSFIGIPNDSFSKSRDSGGGPPRNGGHRNQ